MRTFDIEGPVAFNRRVLEDDRGFFTELFRESTVAAGAPGMAWVQDNASLSRARGSVRGLHFQTPPNAQAKLVSVLQGAIFDVAVDLRRGSPTYGRHIAIELSAENGVSLLVPVGFAHGFCTLRPDTIVTYKVSAYYDAASDKGLAWDDPALDIDWPARPGAAVLSDKDRTHPRLADLPPVFA